MEEVASEPGRWCHGDGGGPHIHGHKEKEEEEDGIKSRPLSRGIL